MLEALRGDVLTSSAASADRVTHGLQVWIVTKPEGLRLQPGACTAARPKRAFKQQQAVAVGLTESRITGCRLAETKGGGLEDVTTRSQFRNIVSGVVLPSPQESLCPFACP
jgi:hypothetical protein